MLDTKYSHKEVEENKYQFWLEKDYFTAGKDKSKEPYCIVIPPPNVTGKLHLGHAWDTTIQDILIRYKRMDGYDALWLPGMDHAGIATQAKVDKKLKDMGYNPRQMDRGEWLKYAWDWKEEYANNIHEQWKKLGLSLDYTKERFTLDEGLSKAVKHVFVTLYNEGLIYTGSDYNNGSWSDHYMTISDYIKQLEGNIEDYKEEIAELEAVVEYYYNGSVDVDSEEMLAVVIAHIEKQIAIEEVKLATYTKQAEEAKAALDAYLAE